MTSTACQSLIIFFQKQQDLRSFPITETSVNSFLIIRKEIINSPKCCTLRIISKVSDFFVREGWCNSNYLQVGYPAFVHPPRRLSYTARNVWKSLFLLFQWSSISPKSWGIDLPRWEKWTCLFKVSKSNNFSELYFIFLSRYLYTFILRITHSCQKYDLILTVL